MMIGVAEPHQWGKEHSVPHALGSAPNDFIQEQAVGEQRQMPSMLFECGHRKDNGSVSVERLNRRPIQIGQLHKGIVSVAAYRRSGTKGKSGSILPVPPEWPVLEMDAQEKETFLRPRTADLTTAQLQF